MQQSSHTSRQDAKSIWIVTDVPFWQLANGSHQRIESLTRALHEHGFRLGLWFVGSMEPLILDRLRRSGRWELITGPAFPPASLGRRLRWSFAGLIHAMRQLFHQRRQIERDIFGSKTLEDFRVPEISNRLRQDVRHQKPDVLLFEYLTFSFAADSIRSSMQQRPQLLCDTHDVMHRRAASHQLAGKEHWLQIDAGQEAAALSAFDTLVAIQPDEVRQFRELCPETEVIECGHPVFQAELESKVEHLSDAPQVRVGMVAGGGDANVDGLRRFLVRPWPELLQSASDSVQLRLAGDICESVRRDLGERRLADLSIELDGRVDDLAAWYRSIDIAINPATMGAGLKIKSVEALAHGCCLVATQIGLEGVAVSEQQGAFQVSAVEQMEEPLRRLIHDRQLRAAASRAAGEHIRNNCHPAIVCRDLFRVCSRTSAKVSGGD